MCLLQFLYLILLLPNRRAELTSHLDLSVVAARRFLGLRLRTFLTLSRRFLSFPHRLQFLIHFSLLRLKALLQLFPQELFTTCSQPRSAPSPSPVSASHPGVTRPRLAFSPPARADRDLPQET